MEGVDSEESIEPEQPTVIEVDEQVDLTEEGEDEQQPTIDHSISESIKYLQEHGITMLPADESNILSTVMESGHSVVLTGEFVVIKSN